MAEGEIEVAVRQARGEDVPHIVSTWLHTFRQQGLAKGVRPRIYQDRQSRLIARILAKPTVHALVATPPDDDFVILAWGVFEAPNTVHYLYTKEPFRKLGLARKLLTAVAEDFLYSHRTDDFAMFLRMTTYRAKYDPYAGFKGAP